MTVVYAFGDTFMNVNITRKGLFIAPEVPLAPRSLMTRGLPCHGAAVYLNFRRNRPLNQSTRMTMTKITSMIALTC